MTPWSRWVTTLAVLLGVLAGCPRPASQAPPAQPASHAPAPAPPSSQPPPPTPVDARIVLHRTGGIAGIDDTTTVEPDGSWTHSSTHGTPRSGQLTENQRSRLRVLAADPHLRTESTRTPVATNCRDAFNYTLSVGQTRVSYTDCPTDPDRPEAAVAIVELLTGLAA